MLQEERPGVSPLCRNIHQESDRQIFGDKEREKNNSQGWVSGPHARLSSPALLSEGVFGNGRGWIRGPMISQKLIFRSLLQREEMLGGDLESSPPVCKQEDGKLLMNFICKWPFDSKMKRIPGTHFTL